MLRIHARVLLALLALVFTTGAATAGLVIGLAIEQHWFMAGAAVIGVPAMIIWAAHGQLMDRQRELADAES